MESQSVFQAKTQAKIVPIELPSCRGTGFTWGQLRAVKFDEMRTIVKIIQVIGQSKAFTSAVRCGVEHISILGVAVAAIYRVEQKKWR